MAGTRPHRSNHGAMSTAAAAALIAVAVGGFIYVQRKRKDETNTDRAILSRNSGPEMRPPFPQEVRNLLSKCHLAYLSTVDAAAGSSHLSLMRFTYLQDAIDGEVVIMSTNTKTKKFEMLQRQNGVALLVHDFQQSPCSKSGNFSITLNGSCRIVTATAKREHYRQAHLKHNPDYPQFIIGEDIAILCIDVKSARICNVNDQVIHWDVANGKQDDRTR